MRTLVVVVCLCGAAWSHGGTFRPPPRPLPRDPVRTPVRPGGPTAVTTRSAAASVSLAPWEFWWNHNRDRYLLLRDRLRSSAVVTGPRSGKETFDRAAVRARLEPILMEALGDRDPAVRGAAAIALGKFGARAARARFVAMRERDKAKEVREAAVVALMLLRDPEAASVLKKLALDRRQPRRERGLAVLGLGLLGDQAFLESVLTARRGALGSNSDTNELKACAAHALGFVGSESVVVPLAKIAFDRRADRHARGFAAASLGRVGHPLAVPEVIRLIRDREQLDQARQGAAIAAGSLVRPDDEKLVDLLVRKAKGDRDLGVRQQLIFALGRIGGVDAATHLASVIRSRDARLRGHGLLALGLTGSRDAGPLLLREFDRLAKSSDRGACALGLALAGHAPAIPVLRKRAARRNPEFLRHGLLALALLRDKETLPLVREVLDDSADPLVRRDAAVALALLHGSAGIPELVAQLTKTKTLFARAAIVHALGLVGTDRAVDPLLALYRNKRLQAEERAMAIAALGRIGDPEDPPLVSRFAFDLHPHVSAEAITELITIL